MPVLTAIDAMGGVIGAPLTVPGHCTDFLILRKKLLLSGRIIPSHGEFAELSEDGSTPDE